MITVTIYKALKSRWVSFVTLFLSFNIVLTIPGLAT